MASSLADLRKEFGVAPSPKAKPDSLAALKAEFGIAGPPAGSETRGVLAAETPAPRGPAPMMGVGKDYVPPPSQAAPPPLDQPLGKPMAPHEALIMGAVAPEIAGVAPLAARAIGGGIGNAMFGASSDILEGRNPVNFNRRVTDFDVGAVAGPTIDVVTRPLGTRLNRLFGKGRGVPSPRGAEAQGTAAEHAPSLTVSEKPEALVKRQPFTGESAQQYPGPSGADVAEALKSDPQYLQRLRDLGGGRVVSNRETIEKAIAVGPMHPDELAAHQAGTAVNEVDVARGMMTFDWTWQRLLHALETGDRAGVNAAGAEVQRMMPGLENLRATPGRSTQVQSLFVQDKIAQAAQEIADLQAKGLPLEQIQKAWAAKKAQLLRDSSIRAAGNRVRDAIGALETYATAAKLTSPVTHAINSISNALTFWTVRPLEKVLRAGAYLGQRDPVSAASELQALFGTTEGLKNGARKYLSVLMEDAPEATGKLAEGAAKGYRLPKALRPFDPFRQLSAADTFWKEVLKQQELTRMAWDSAARRYKGPALQREVTRLLNDPPTPWLDEAQKVADEYTFQEATDSIGKGLGALQKIPGARFVIPFVRTPYNIAKFQFQRSPLGVLSPRNLRGITAGGKEQAEALGRLGAGGILAGAAWALVKSGDVTGNWPTDQKERALWEAEGRQAHSIRVGDRWLRYDRFQPLGMYLANAASLRDAQEAGDEKGAAAMTARLIADGGRAILDQPFVSGMSSLLDAIQDPARNAGKFVANTAQGLVPNILRDVRYQTDATMREAKGAVAGVTNMLPGASKSLPPKVDLFGREETYDPSRAARATKVLSTGRETPETRAMRESGYRVTEPSSTLDLGKRGGKRKLSPDQQAQFEKEMGEATRRAISEASRSTAYQKADEETRQDLLERAVKAARDPVRKRWKLGITQGP